MRPETMPCGVSRPNGSFSILLAVDDPALALVGIDGFCTRAFAAKTISSTASAEETARMANLDVICSRRAPFRN